MYSLHTQKSTDELENIALNFITKVIFDKQKKPYLSLLEAV